MADDHQASRLARPINRRGLIRGAVAAGTLAVGAIGPSWLGGLHRTAGQEIQTIAEDVEQRGQAFARGERRSVDLSSAQREDRELVAAAGGSGQEFISEPVQLDFPITHIGAHWITSTTGGTIAVDLRSSSDGAAWSEWFTTDVEWWDGVAPNPGTFASLVHGDRATFVQFRLRFDTSGGDIRVRRLTLTCLNSVDGARARILLPSGRGAEAAVAKPSVVTRAAWGAVESYRFRNGREIWPREYVTTQKVVVHHTATSNAYSAVSAEVRAIYYYHAVTQGWGDIGYHALIGNDNRIYEGRVGRDGEHVSLDVVAGHVRLANEGTMGISNIGIFMTVPIPSGMLDAGAKIAAWICDQRDIDPKGTGPFRRSDGTVYNGWNIPGHRQIASPSSPTECPGDVGITQMPNFRDRVAAKIAASYTPTASIDPSRGTVNTWVNFSIQGFPRNLSVQIHWRRTSGSYIEVGTVATNSGGTATGRIRVPATPGGNDQIVRFSLGSIRADAFYDVAPRIKAIPNSAPRGATIDVSLRGFGKKEVVRIRWRRGAGWQEITRVTTSNTGSFNRNVVVPSWAPDGPTSIRGDGTTFRAQTNAFAVGGGAFQPAEGTPSPSPTVAPVTETPTVSPTEPTATVELPTSTPTEPPATPTSTAEPSPTETPTLEPTATEGTPVDGDD